ncbi:MAG: putative porin, partial [Cyclobacteriaceae bacterium]
ASFSHLKNRVATNGGIKADSTDDILTLFDFELEEANLTIDGKIIERRHNFHLLHQYQLTEGKGVQLFHQFETHSQVNRYSDFNVGANIDYYTSKNYFVTDTIFSANDTLPFASSMTRDEFIFKQYRNKVGIKGSVKGLYYQLYARNSLSKYTNKNFYSEYESPVFSEQFIGGAVLLDPVKDLRFIGKAELGLGRDYLLNPELQFKKAKVGLKLLNYSPTLLQNRYESLHFSWNNDFRNTNLQELYANTSIQVGKIELTPSISISNLQRYIYFNQNATPDQAGNDFTIIKPSLGYKLALGALNIDGFVNYTKLTDDSYLRVPEFLFQQSTYLEGRIFSRALHFQFGLDLKRSSSYFANDFNPITQQFYLQDSFKVPSYWLGDLFFNFKVKSTTVFFRLHNVLAGRVGNDAGYFTTPFYTGLPGSFDFGVKWPFFD